MNTFGDLRKSKGFTQASLAKILDVDQSTVCLWEKGKTYPRRETAFRLARLFGCSLDDVFLAIHASAPALEKSDS